VETTPGKYFMFISLFKNLRGLFFGAFLQYFPYCCFIWNYYWHPDQKKEHSYQSFSTTNTKDFFYFKLGSFYWSTQKFKDQNI
jgi:hypothetical protein